MERPLIWEAVFFAFLRGVHIRCGGDGGYWFRPYGPAGLILMRVRFPVGAVECNEAAPTRRTTYVRIPRPLTSNRAHPRYSTTVATSMNVIAMLILMSDTPRMP